MNNFDRVAWCYDFFKQLIFGNELDQASTHWFSTIKANANVLILGGGTGKILHHLPEARITYLEKSSRMIKMAQKRYVSGVEFIHVDFLDYQPSQSYDYIICPFVLDLFEPGTLQQVIDKINRSLSRGGQLLVTDFAFRNSNLLKLMYFGFGMVSSVQAKSIPPIHQLLSDSGFKLLGSTQYFNGLIFSHHYKCPTK